MRTITRLLLFSMVFCLNYSSSSAQLNKDSLWSVWNSATANDTLRIDAIDQLAWFGYRVSDPDSCILLAKMQGELAEELFYLEGRNSEIGRKHRATSFDTQGTALQRKGKFREALVPYYEALDFRRASKDEKGLLNSLRFMGVCYSRLDENEKALAFWNEGLELSRNLSHDYSTASFLNNLGVAEKYHGNYLQAYEHYSEALLLSEKIGRKGFRADCLNNIGSLNYELKNYTKALSYQEESLSIKKELNNVSRQATTYNNIALIKIALGDSAFKKGNQELKLQYFSSARNILDENLARTNRLKNSYEYSIALKVLARLQIKEKSYDLALDNLDRSIETFKEKGALSGFASRYKLKGDAYYEQMLDRGNTAIIPRKREELLQLAIENYTKALQLSEDEGVKRDVLEASEALYDCYKLVGNNTKALEMYELTVTTQKKIENADMKWEVAKKELDYRYAAKIRKDSLELAGERYEMAVENQSLVDVQAKTVNRTKAILCFIFLGGLGVFIRHKAVRKRKDRIQKEDERQLKIKSTTSEMKALSSQMNPHFIFNALQSIQHFILKEEVDDADEYLSQFSFLMRKVLENSRHAEVKIKDEIEVLEVYMQLERIRLEHPFEYEIQIQSSIDIETRTIPPLILQPIIENAIWHGIQMKGGPGNIRIEMRETQEALVCIVTDNGVGRTSHDVSDKSQSSDKKKSLGMEITNERLNVRAGNTEFEKYIEVEDLINTQGEPIGTKVRLRIIYLNDEIA